MLSHDLARPRDKRLLCFYGRESPTVSHHPDNFAGDRYLVIRDMIILVGERQNSTSSKLNRPLLFTSNHMT